MSQCDHRNYAIGFVNAMKHLRLAAIHALVLVLHTKGGVHEHSSIHNVLDTNTSNSPTIGAAPYIKIIYK